jgi:hypothetical protein
MKTKRELQGEGNYDAAEEFNESEREFVDSGKAESAAGKAAPKTQTEAREMKRAEELGRARAKGGTPTTGAPERKEYDELDDDREQSPLTSDRTQSK